MDGVSAGRQMEEYAARLFSAGVCWRPSPYTLTLNLYAQEQVIGS